MRVYISVDMEGVAGIVHVDQTRSNGQDFAIGRQLMTDEANAAALGAFDAGAREVLVNDSHGDMRNLLFDRLDRRVEVITGSLKPFSMMAGADLKHDAAFFIGYHAGMGARGAILDHTYSGACVGEIAVNGRPLSETGLNALVCGQYGTPVALVAGDERCCAEAKEQLGAVETVVTKWAFTRTSARALHPAEACRRIREGARRALKARKRFKPLRMQSPYALRIRFLNSGLADGAEVMPGAERLDGTTVLYEARDVAELFRAMLALTRLADQQVLQVRPK
jgi:D-amino peptidase